MGHISYECKEYVKYLQILRQVCANKICLFSGQTDKLDTLDYVIGHAMPYMSKWVNEPYIYRTTFTGLISIDEVDTIMHEFLDILTTNESVYFILDFGRAATVPTTLLQIDSIIEVIHHDNTEWFAVVNPTGFDNNTTRLLAQEKVKIFDNKDKALGFLRGMVRLDTGTTLDDN